MFSSIQKGLGAVDRFFVGRVFLPLIRFYQFALSPLLQPHGSNCRFYPTCSEYAVGSLTSHGLIKGSFYSIRRLLKCHPFHPGGVDLVPEHHTSCNHSSHSENSSNQAVHKGLKHG